jgi:hypothetical protein
MKKIKLTTQSSTSEPSSCSNWWMYFSVWKVLTEFQGGRFSLLDWSMWTSRSMWTKASINRQDTALSKLSVLILLSGRLASCPVVKTLQLEQALKTWIKILSTGSRAYTASAGRVSLRLFSGLIFTALSLVGSQPVYLCFTNWYVLEVETSVC